MWVAEWTTLILPIYKDTRIAAGLCESGKSQQLIFTSGLNVHMELKRRFRSRLSLRLTAAEC
jgi:hypothetical protein